MTSKLTPIVRHVDSGPLGGQRVATPENVRRAFETGRFKAAVCSSRQAASRASGRSALVPVLGHDMDLDPLFSVRPWIRGVPLRDTAGSAESSRDTKARKDPTLQDHPTYEDRDEDHEL